MPDTFDDETDVGPLGRDRGRELDIWAGTTWAKRSPKQRARTTCLHTDHLQPTILSLAHTTMARTAPTSGPDREKFDRLVQEEMPIQRASVAMEGGMPSCLTLFDNYLLCYCGCPCAPSFARCFACTELLPLATALAAQFRAVYRFGQPAGCPAKFEDFKFCMSLKGVSDARKEEVWIKRRAESWAERRMGKNSEDVWTART